MNKVPKPWYEKELYCQLVPNTDDQNKFYDSLPRIGAFEISSVYDNADILFFSKLSSRMWPHCSSIACKIIKFIEEARSMSTSGHALKERYQTKGELVRQASRSSLRSTIGSKASLRSAGSVRSIRSKREALKSATVATKKQLETAEAQ